MKFIKTNILLISFVLGISFLAKAQTWTDVTSTAPYSALQLSGNKDGGHSWADFDLDGDFDLLVNLNSGSKLLRNNSGTFVDVTGTLTNGMTSNRERSAVWGDVNGDGYPDFMRNSSYSGVELRIQHPGSGIFGDGLGGTTPYTFSSNANSSTNTYVSDGVNTEGIGFLDFDQDGDLDVYMDNHDHGIDILENDGTGSFTHVTPGNGVVLGLNQSSADGDYGSVTDFNNDGFVDIMVRKRDQNDLFQNNGGTFINGTDLAQANNGNKGAASFYDFDNDGDFDLFWTENGLNQIFENQNGNWVALSESTTGIYDNASGGLPNYSGQIEGLACGDVDNDGDIDIFLAGNEGYLWLNNYNNGNGSAMTFTLSSQSFPINGNGEGCTLVDTDADGDLDLYINSSTGNNHLYKNNLTTNNNSFLFIDIKENRTFAGFSGLTGIGNERYATGACVQLIDCDNNVISGLREVNGGNGHGTQDVSRVHFGLPSGANTPVIVEVFYPAHNSNGNRIIYRQEVLPSSLGAGAARIQILYPVIPSNNSPIGKPDDFVINGGTTALIFNPLANNGNGVDSDPDGDPLTIASIVGNGPSNGSVTINSNTSITYTPSYPIIDGDYFEYYLSDNSSCIFAGNVDTVSVNILLDSDNDGIPNNIDIDDDNDGIPDIDECSFNTNTYGPFNTSNTTWDFTGNGGVGNAILNSMTHNDGTNTVTYTGFIFPDAYEEHYGTSNINHVFEVNNNVDGNTGGTSGNNISNPNWNNLILPAFQSNNLNYFQKLDAGIVPSDYYKITYNSPITVYGNEFLLISERGGNNPSKIEAFDNSGTSLGAPVLLAANSATYLNNTGCTASNGQAIEVAVYALTDFAPLFAKIKYFEISANSTGDGADGKVIIVFNSTDCADSDLDGIPNSLDLDSDNDGCSDAYEVGATTDLGAEYQFPVAGGDVDGLSGVVDPDADGTPNYTMNAAPAIDGTPSCPAIDPCDAYTSGNPDADNDLVSDICDVDSDNDGITDSDEGCYNNELLTNGDFEDDDFTDAALFPNGFASANGTFIGTSYNSNNITGWIRTENFDGWVQGGNWAQAYHGNQYIDVLGNMVVDHGNATVLSNKLSQVFPTIIGADYTFSFYYGEDVGHQAGESSVLNADIIDANNTVLSANTITVNAVGPLGGIKGPNNWYLYSISFRATTLTTKVQFQATPPNISPPTSSPYNDGGDYSAGVDIDFVSIKRCDDFDQDGIPNAMDIDSDNDGIVDIIEAGGIDTDKDGHIDYPTAGDPTSMTDTDGDGLSEDPVVDTDNDGTADQHVDTDVVGGVAIPNTNTDSDLNPNYLDIDSDNDGIVDNIEGQSTAGHTLPSGNDTDGDGLDDAYDSDDEITVGLGGGTGTSIDPNDEDSDSNPDYTDLDTDNDGISDNIEGWDISGNGVANTSASGNDADEDGLDDAFDTDLAGTTNNGGPDNTGTVPSDFPDLSPVGGDLDWRETCVAPTTPTAGSNSPICLGNTINLTASNEAGATYSWTGPNGFISASQNPSISTSTLIMSGSYSVTTTVVGCVSAAGSTTVTISSPGNAGTVSGTNAICSGSTTTFTTTGSGGTWSSGTTSVATVNSGSGLVTGVSAGTSVITYTVSASGGCPAVTATRTVTVTAPGNAGTVSGTNAICSGSTTTFTTTGSGGTWSSTTTSVATVNATSGVITGITAGTSVITYTVVGAGGCPTVTATRIVTVTAPGDAGVVSGTNVICSGLTTTFTTTGSGGTWSSATTSVATVNATSGLITSVSVGTSVITYIVPGSGGCPSVTDTKTITINAIPVTPTVSSNTPICATTGTINLTVSNQAGAIYNWSGPNAFVSTMQNPSIGSATIAMSGAYSVTTIVAGCTSSSASTTVAVSNCGPTATDDIAGTNLSEDGANGIINVITNDSDIDGTPSAPSNGAGQYVVDLNPTMGGVQTTFTDASGTWTYNPTTGVVTFDPANDYNGIATITYELSDPEGNSDQATITFTVDSINDAPSQGNETLVIDEDEPNPTTTVDLTTNNIDPDGTNVDFSQVISTTGGGIITDNNDGTIDYTPAPNFNGIDTVVYEVCDNGLPMPGICVNDTLFVTVNPVNDPPIVDNEFISVPINGSTSGDLTDAGDSDVDGNLVVTTIPLDGPDNGTIVINPDGTFTYTPNTGYVGLDTVVVTICDDGTPLPANCTTDTIFINVLPTNPPVATDNNDTTTEDNAVTFNVTGDDTDSDGTIDNGTVDLDPGTSGIQTTFTDADGNIWTVDINGDVTFTPAQDYNGAATISYTVNDDDGATSNTADLTVEVSPVNDEPIIDNENITTPEETPVSGDLTDAGDSDVDGNLVITTTPLDGPDNGTIIINPDGTFTYTPNPDFNGTDTVVVTICDDGTPLPANCTTDTIFVTVRPVNDPPVATDNNGTTTEDNSVTINVTGDDTDVDGTIDNATVDLDPTTPGIDNTYTDADGNVWTVDANGDVTFTPAQDYNGTATIDYTVNDNEGGTSNVASITIVVDPINDTPIVDNEYISVPLGGSTSGDLTDTGDTDVDGNLIATFTPISGPSNGTVLVFPDGSYTYTGNPGFIGLDTVIVEVCDDGSPTPIICVVDTIFITILNTLPPVATDNNSTTTEDTPVTVNVSGDDIDADGTIDDATVDLDPSTSGIQATFTDADGNVWTVDVNGDVTFTPAQDYNGTAVIIYTVNDNDGANSNTATITIVVDPINDAPVVDNENITTPEGTPISGDLTDAGDTDVDGNLVVSVLPFDGPDNGTIVINPDGTYTYTPNPGFDGQDTVVVQICDDGTPLPILCTMDTIFIDVTPVNDPPVIDNEFISVQINGSTSGDLTDVGDSDPDGNLVVNTTPLVDPTNGTIVINPDGTYTYTNTNPTATNDTVVVEICDDGTPMPINCTTDTIFINIVNTVPPVATDNNTSTLEDVAVTVNVSGDDTDADGTIDDTTVDLDPGTPGIQSTFTDADGNLWSVDANGDVTFTPAQDYNGTAVINYTVNDNDGATSNTATITIIVTPVDDAPIATDNSNSTMEDTPVVFNVTGDDTDADGTIADGTVDLDPTTVGTQTTVTTAEGTWIVDGNGNVTFTPAQDFNGTATIDYTVEDNDGLLSNVATITVVVDPINDAPIVDNENIITPEDTPISGDLTDAGDSDVDGNLVVNTTPLDGPDNGTIVINPDGTYTYTPDPEFGGMDTVVVEICDDGTPLPANCTTDTIFIEVTPINDAPIVDNEFISVPVGGSNGGDLTDNGDSDVDGNLVVNTTPLDGPDNGTIVINPDGTYTYTGNPGYLGQDTVVVEICDDGNPLPINCTTDTIFINILNTFPPVATGNDTTTLEDTPITFNVSGDDTDPDGTIDDGTVDLEPGTAGVQTTTTTPEGIWTVDANGDVTFTPNQDFNGTATIDYTVNDNDGANSNTATITVVVEPVNDAPIVDNEDITTPEDTPVSGDLTDAGDSDVDGNLVVTTTPLDGPDNGTIVINPDGTYTYTPNPDFVGNDTIVVTICDDGTPLPANCTTDTIFVEITPINDAPIVDNEFISVPVGGSNGGDLTDFGDSDVDGNLVVNTTPLDGPDNGTVAILSDGTYIYTANSGFVGQDTVVVEICDDGTPLPIICTTDTIFINVINTTPPIATDNDDTTLEDTPITVNVSGDDTDADGTIDDATVDLDPGTAGIQSTFTDADGNVWTVDANGDVTFTPAQDYNGTAVINYTVNDNDGANSNAALITIIVTPVNDAPVVDNEHESFPEDTSFSGDITTSADYDVDGNLVVNTTPIDGPNNGTIIINPDGTYTYTPDQNFNGLDTVVVNICDDAVPTPLCVNDTIFLIVTPVNDSLVVDNEYHTTTIGNPVSGDLTDAGDYDIDGNMIVNTTPIGGPSNGTITINADGTYTYTPDNGYIGLDTVLVEICDDGTPIPGICVTDTIFIEIINCDLTVATDDCDNDGLNNGEETTGVDDPNTPDTPNGNTSDPLNPDTDGDGVTDNLEGNDGTDPNDPCELVFASQNVTPSSAWYNNDCDNDGLTNEEEITGVDNPNTADTPNGNVTDPTNPDTDGDGVVDGTEGTDNTDPNNPCDLVAGNITVTQGGDWNDADCDEDGVTNGQEVLDGTDPNNPCELMVANQTLPVGNGWNDVDCDNDGLTNGEETTGVDDPNTPDTPNGNITDPTNPDSDEDGVIDGTEGTEGTNPNNPCDLVVGNITVAQGDLWNNADCDNDGLTNEEEMTGVDNPSTSDVPNGNVTAPNNPDSDGDGVLDGAEGTDGTDPNDPCDYLEESITLEVTTVAPCSFDIPEGFSPNGDGVNDYFVIEGIEKYEQVNLLVLNRWGNKVYESNAYKNDWDGTNKFGVSIGDGTLPVGTYFYIVDLGEGEKPLKGYVYLNR